VGGGNVGGVKLRSGCEGFDSVVIPHDEVEHAREKMRIGCGMTQGIWTNPALSQKRPQPFGIAGNKGKRLNRNDFSHFAWVMRGSSQQLYLPFRNLWSLFFQRSCPSLRKVFKQVETTSHKDASWA